MFLDFPQPRESNGVRTPGIPGSNIIASTAAGITANAIRYSFFGIERNCTITDVVGQVTGAPTTAAQLAIAIYEVDDNWKPTTLVFSNIFQIATTTGAFSVTGQNIRLSKSNSSGLYAIAVNASATMAVQCFNTAGVMIPNSNISELINRFEVLPSAMSTIVTAGGFPATAPAPTANMTGSEVGFRHPCLFKWSD
jgi:hypothetical protein